jgi:hypothetical protein
LAAWLLASFFAGRPLGSLEDNVPTTGPEHLLGFFCVAHDQPHRVTLGPPQEQLSQQRYPPYAIELHERRCWFQRVPPVEVLLRYNAVVVEVNKSHQNCSKILRDDKANGGKQQEKTLLIEV